MPFIPPTSHTHTHKPSVFRVSSLGVCGLLALCFKNGFFGSRAARFLSLQHCAEVRQRHPILGPTQPLRHSVQFAHAKTFSHLTAIERFSHPTAIERFSHLTATLLAAGVNQFVLLRRWALSDSAVLSSPIIRRAQTPTLTTVWPQGESACCRNSRKHTGEC
jgi:hypothetical protein